MLPVPAVVSRPVNNSCLTLTVIAIVIFASSGLTSEIGTPPRDTRQVYSRQSPNWLRAVGKLQVPGIKMLDGQRSHHLEDCSATLVAGPGRSRADTIITAWHCLEYYEDLSKRITFTLLPDSRDPISSEVYRLADGGSMSADWAILRLYQPIETTRVLPLIVHPDRANKRNSIMMAGYSSDTALGAYGQLLTYDPDCAITRQHPTSSESDCRALKGASGGAVVQVSERGEAWLSGVISEGDGAGISTFVPVAGFRSALTHHLR